MKRFSTRLEGSGRCTPRRPNDRDGNFEDEMPAIFNHVRYYDPVKGFGEMLDWTLHNQRAIDAGQCFREEGVCYFSDDVDHIYKF